MFIVLLLLRVVNVGSIIAFFGANLQNLENKIYFFGFCCFFSNIKILHFLKFLCYNIGNRVFLWRIFYINEDEQMAIKKLNVLIFQAHEQGEPQCWGAQALEYDIYAEGDTISEAMDNFSIVFAAELAYCEKYKLSLSSIGKAPKVFWDMAEQRKAESAPLDSARLLEKIVPMLPKAVRGIGSFDATVMA